MEGDGGQPCLTPEVGENLCWGMTTPLTSRQIGAVKSSIGKLMIGKGMPMSIKKRFSKNMRNRIKCLTKIDRSENAQTKCRRPAKDYQRYSDL